MTLSKALAEYERIKRIESTPDELWEGYLELCRRTDKLNITYYNLCDNDEKEGDPWP